MKKPPLLFALVGGFTAILVALPPVYAMDIMERIVTTQTQSIRREATEYQRKVAEANARAYMARQLRALQHHAIEAEATPKPKKKDKVVENTPEATPKAHKPEHEHEAEDVHAMKKKLPRYVAVDTVKDKRSAPGTKKDVMIWDTQSEALIGNSVYDVQNPPPVGSMTKFETFSAQYVGNGM